MHSMRGSHLIEVQGDRLRQQVGDGFDLVRLRMLQGNRVRLQAGCLEQTVLYLYLEFCKRWHTMYQDARAVHLTDRSTSQIQCLSRASRQSQGLHE